MVATETLIEYGGIILSLLLLEAVLSFDNAAILAAMVRRLPVEDRRKALLYGLVGAYALRLTAILLATVLIENQWLKFIGGGYLIYLFLHHFWMYLRHKEEKHHEINVEKSILLRMGIPMFWATIIQVELIDLAFALDQVLAAVAFVQQIPRPDSIILIVCASFMGILFLRLAAVAVVKVMDWLPVLEHMAYIAVGFVGIKLILTFTGDTVFGIDLPGLNHGHGYHIPNLISIAITLALFATPVAMKLFFNYPPSVVHDEAAADSEE